MSEKHHVADGIMYSNAPRLSTIFSWHDKLFIILLTLPGQPQAYECACAL